MSDKVKLYTKDNKGAMRFWSIHSEEDTLVMEHGQVGGSIQVQTEIVEENQSGRDIDEQIDLRMNSRISRKIDKGYVHDYETAKNNKASNRLGLPKPMLAAKLVDVKNIDYTNAVTQPKFDGNRCMIYCEDGVNKAYTRNGKQIETIQHILDDITIDDDTILDGELYCHGYPLQTIVSWVKRLQGNTLKLKFHLYDIVLPNSPYNERSAVIRGLPLGNSISSVYGDSIASHEDVMANFRRYRAEGYEGAIIRWGDAGYEDGKRSKHLVKVKEWIDEDFMVIEINPSADGWAILTCLAGKNDKTFTVSAPGTMDDKFEVMRKKLKYTYRKVTVEYANLTKDGIPFHPVAIKFKEDTE